VDSPDARPPLAGRAARTLLLLFVLVTAGHATAARLHWVEPRPDWIAVLALLPASALLLALAARQWLLAGLCAGGVGLAFLVHQLETAMRAFGS